MRAALVITLLYLFLVGVSAIESGIFALGAGFQEGLLASVSHPLAGLSAGILATVLVQSSSVSTATIVGLVGSGVLGLPVAVPMIMGANIGTTVTSTLAALGNIRRTDEFRRGFAAATVHDMFNLAGVAILLPLEMLTGWLGQASMALAEVLRGTEINAGPSSSPIRDAVNLPVQVLERLIDPDRLGTLAGILLLIVGLVLIFLALALITKNMRRLVAGTLERTINRIVGRGGGVMGIVVGIAVTLAVQSSSITTSILVPLVASGIMSLPSAYPITLGANIGTTITALLASLAVVRPEGLAIALVHTLFNVTALLIIYPIPKIRMLPARAAEWLADQAVEHHTVVVVYVLGLFIALPALGMLLLN